MNQAKIGAFLAQLRKEKNMTQGQLSERLSVSPQAVSKWERGESSPDISLLPALASIYSLSVDEIVNGERKAEAVGKREKDLSRLFSPLLGIAYGLMTLLFLAAIQIFIYYHLGSGTTLTSYKNLYDLIFESKHYLYGNYFVLFAFVFALCGFLTSAVLFFRLPRKVGLVIVMARNVSYSLLSIFLLAFAIGCRPLPTNDYFYIAFMVAFSMAFWLLPSANPFATHLYSRK